MPLYEYGCESCSNVFEAYKRISENAKKETCPRCGGAGRKKEISLFRALGKAVGSEGKGSSCGPRRSPFG